MYEVFEQLICYGYAIYPSSLQLYTHHPYCVMSDLEGSYLPLVQKIEEEIFCPVCTTVLIFNLTLF